MMAFAHALDPAEPAPATMGLIVLQADETIEQDFRRSVSGAEARLFVSRVPSRPTVTRDTLAEMSRTLPAAAALFPDPVRFDVVGYGCTSGSSVIGPDRVADLIGSACRTAHVTNPLSALIALCRARGVTRLTLLSPYIEEVSETLRQALDRAGITTPVFGSFDIAEEEKVARISERSIVDAAVSLGRSGDTDALFLSCTNLRTLDAIPRIEAALGRPVFSSNQALAWHMRALAQQN